MKQPIILLLLSVCFSVNAKAAPPSLGADCGVGATIVATSSRDAGKLTIGADPAGCTLSFSWPGGKAPSCSAMVERNSDPFGYQVQPSPLGTITTPTTLFIGDTSNYVPTLQQGFVISYLCVGQ